MSSESPSTLDLIGKLLGVIASLSIGISLVYDWGFFSTIGLSMAQVPASISDHASSAMDWAPAVIGAFIPYFALEILTRRIEQGKTEQEIIESSPNPEWTRKFRAGPDKLIFVVALLGALLYIFLGEVSGSFGIFAVIVLWLFFSKWAQDHPRIIERRPWKLRLAIMILPALAMFFWGLGHYEAIKIFHAPPSAKLTFAGAKAPIDVSVLRYLDKGVLMKDGTGGVSFRQWSAIERIEMTASLRAQRGLLCSWFQVACINLQPKPATPPTQNHQ